MDSFLGNVYQSYVKMPRNVEVKAKVHNWDHTRKECEALSKSAGETLAQRDVFFNTEHGRLKLRDFQDGRGQLIYYERPDLQGPKLSNYSISSTSDPHGLEEVLTQALGVRGSVVKQRLLFLVGQTRIHLDRVQDLGDFLELEALPAKMTLFLACESSSNGQKSQTTRKPSNRDWRKSGGCGKKRNNNHEPASLRPSRIAKNTGWS
uniref:CYTH domain-containing protein n=1 Tax=Leptobrachium leishanense TaxID=445787 RepID=A0A8C5MV10_9ANUR